MRAKGSVEAWPVKAESDLAVDAGAAGHVLEQIPFAYGTVEESKTTKHTNYTKPAGNLRKLAQFA